MSGQIDSRLAELGIDVPQAAAPVANYVGWVRTGNLVVISGQLPLKDGKVTTTGLLGRDVSVEDAAVAARQSGINIIAQLRAACGGDLDKVVRIVRLGGFVACTPDFTDHPKVINGASDLMVDVFGDAGRHARAAVGCPSLPLNAAVEVDALVEIRD
ncbi:RidA family protein [Novispirillum itersonii]|uniref:Enamine deaminase RidA (YjgF/YER057c/UK114 family) n=1 Tax=Novispirillum itersonii TaxID=189 RepID=A0A7X0DM51_NOVIT|nr:RidA family protein [Novispirillum itersonii]MBB6208832.1 enamine deaminase RidA (YjgF/YER057c/UK114 family) [Novispirillum itersonii]